MLKFPDQIRHLEIASTGVYGESLFHAAALIIFFNYKGKANDTVILLKVPSLTFSFSYRIFIAFKLLRIYAFSTILQGLGI